MAETKQKEHAASDETAIERVTLEVISSRLATLATGQTAMNSALGLMLDTLHAQTNLLRKLSEYASETPAPSPVAKVLGELVSAVTDMDTSIGSLEKTFGELSRTISDAFEIKLDQAAAPQPDGRAD
jgi:hypothetical protein